MRLILAAVLLILAGCVEAHPKDFQAFALRLQFDKGLCSGTVVGPDLILSASHCWQGNRRLVKINGAEAYAVKIIHDGKDHALVRVTTKFKAWAKLGAYPEAGDRIRWTGNPAGEAGMYREGYVSRATKDELAIVAPGFGGDSGAGIYDDRGRLVAVVSATKLWQTQTGQRFELTIAWPLAFTVEQWEAMT